MLNCNNSTCQVKIPQSPQAPPSPPMRDVFAAAFWCARLDNYEDYLNTGSTCADRPVTGLPLLTGQFTLDDAVKGTDCIAADVTIPSNVYLPSLQVVQDICTSTPICKGSYPTYPSCV